MLKYRVRAAAEGEGYEVTIERSKHDVLDRKPAKTMVEGLKLRDGAQAIGAESFADVDKPKAKAKEVEKEPKQPEGEGVGPQASASTGEGGEGVKTGQPDDDKAPAKPKAKPTRAKAGKAK